MAMQLVPPCPPITLTRNHVPRCHMRVASSFKCRSYAAVRQIGSTEYQVNRSWVLAPKQQVKGIVHLVGGAFAGAAPQLAVAATNHLGVVFIRNPAVITTHHPPTLLEHYPLLSHLLSNAGYTVIATPFAVTFKHVECAQALQQMFEESVTELQGPQGLPWLVPAGAPLIGVGHSNGALLHLLMGSLCRPTKTANVIISFNNREVSGAIPIPLDTLKPIADSIAGNGRAAGSDTSPTELLANLVQPLTSVGVLAKAQGTAVQPVLSQLQDVFGEVGAGQSDFSPTPQESRDLIAQGYAVPQTLLVQFENDNIDQTQEMLQLLRQQGPQDIRDQRAVESMLLPGSHVTPCGGELPVQGVQGPLTGPLAQALRRNSQGDVRRLASQIVAWLNRNVASQQ